MTTICKYLLSFIDGWSRARAATALSRLGQYEAAKRLMLKD